MRYSSRMEITRTTHPPDPFITAVRVCSDRELIVMRETLEAQQHRMEGRGQATTAGYAGTLQKLIIVIDEQRKRAEART